MKFLLLTILAAATAQPAQNATTFSLLYGYPLLAWQSLYPSILGEVGANTWYHARQLSTAANRTVVKPNVDTIYSTLIYDLSRSNVEVSIPEVPAENFKLFSFYDPFGDNYANVGTGGFYKSGKYLIHPYDRPGGSRQVGLQVVNGSSEYAGTISSPTSYGTLLVRWGVNSTNVDTVHEWQNECGSRVLPALMTLPNESTEPPLHSLIDVYNENNSVATNVLNLLAKFAPHNAPSAQLEAAGIGLLHGKYTPVSSVNLEEANATAVAEAAKAAADPSTVIPMNDGWTVLSPKLIGVYGMDYALRTVVAISGYLALRNPFAVYPNYSNSSNANAPLTIGPNEAILVTFSRKPPLQEAGFWSVTAYGSDYYLIPNSRDVYALGDRSNLTFAKGKAVYGTSGEDGMFQILMQPADVLPPSNWTSNWLPAPTGGGEVIPQLRFFVAQKAITDGSYKYPVLEKIVAITASNTSGGASNASSSSSARPPSPSSAGTSTGAGVALKPSFATATACILFSLLASALLL